MRLGLGLVVVASLACGGLSEPQPDLAHPTQFSQNGLQFGYPGNWSATTDTEPAGAEEIVSVTIESPGNALAIVQHYPAGIRPDLDQATSIMVDTMASAVSDESAGVAGMAPPVTTSGTRQIAGAARDMRTATYTITMFGVDVPHHLNLYAVGDVLVITNVADEDAAMAAQGFDQILDSLVVP
jgi:hypothetical protein